MGEILINNYNVANRLDTFERAYLKPLIERIDKAEKILKDKNIKMTSKERDKAENAFDALCDKSVDFKFFLRDVRELVDQHEHLVSRLSEMHTTWYHKIAYHGKQPKEMMNMQVDMLQKIFDELDEILKPINDEYERKTNSL